jgi:hypothetical protein
MKYWFIKTVMEEKLSSWRKIYFIAPKNMILENCITVAA